MTGHGAAARPRKVVRGKLDGQAHGWRHGRWSLTLRGSTRCVQKTEARPPAQVRDAKVTYVVEFKNTLNVAIWNALGDFNTTSTVSDTPQRFYRLQQTN